MGNRKPAHASHRPAPEPHPEQPHLEQTQRPEDEDADPVGRPPKPSAPPPPRLDHVEQAADRVPKPAEEPAERTAEVLHQELELTRAGVTSPEESPPPSR